LLPILTGNAQGQAHARCDPGTVEPQQVDLFLARERQLLAVLPGLELQRQHAHAHQVGAVDAFETFCQHRLDPQQVGALGRPVTAGAGAVFLAGDDHQRRALGLITHGGVIDRKLFTAGHVHGVATFLAGQHLVADADIGEGAAHHHFVVAAP